MGAWRAAQAVIDVDKAMSASRVAAGTRNRAGDTMHLVIAGRDEYEFRTIEPTEASLVSGNHEYAKNARKSLNVIHVALKPRHDRRMRATATLCIRPIKLGSLLV